jgi:DNA-binding CsgD family transcriptional regulator
MSSVAVGASQAGRGGRDAAGHGPRQWRPFEGWDSLTDTERRVAELVAEGWTHQETGARM